jgi:ligand-binding SRPBCC domain-containing protein
MIQPMEKGTLMTDIVSYQPPLGLLGSVANTLIIKGKLNEIFDYRTKALDEIF